MSDFCILVKKNTSVLSGNTFTSKGQKTQIAMAQVGGASEAWGTWLQGYLSSSMMSLRSHALFMLLLLFLTCYLFDFGLIALWLQCPCPSTRHQNCIQTEELEGWGSEVASLHFFSLGKIVFQNPSSKFPLVSNWPKRSLMPVSRKQAKE